MKRHKNATSNSRKTFIALVRAGLWEKDTLLLPFGKVDYEEVMRLAEEQSVVGLITVGLEHVKDVKVPQEWVLQFIGSTLQIEEQNKAMNSFIEDIVGKLRESGIYTIIVKGQGIAQCYERPMWRASGDVDFLLDEDNYEKAKAFLTPMADTVEKESDKHQGMNIGSCVVEIHGDQHCGLSARMDRMIDEVQKEVFCEGKVRTWVNGNTTVILPAPDEDVFIVFTHFIKHFFKEGLGLRQICDWCRLLWRYKDSLNHGLLESRIKKAGLRSEWCAFAAFAVEYLGMPKEAMPMFDSSSKFQDSGFKEKAERILKYVMEVGNMGHNRDDGSDGRRTFIARKVASFSRRVADFCNHALIFPMDSLRFFPSIVFNGIRLAAKGIG